MRKKKKENLAEAVNDEELKENAKLAFDDENDEPESSENTEEKPILSEEELKIKRARKTKLAVAAFVLLLGVGIMGNWYYENSDFSANVKPVISSKDTKTLGEAEYVDATAQASDSESKYFSEARVNRQKARDEATEALQKIIDKADAGESEKKEAAKRLADISGYIEIENKIETLVSAKGVNNCLAVVSEDGKRVDVIVDVPELTDAVILQVKEIAMQQLGCSFENVTIIQSNKEAEETEDAKEEKEVTDETKTN